MKELEKDFPTGITYQYSYDVSKFLDASIEQVTHTIRDAFILVALVVFIFLGDWRATLIPILAVPGFPNRGFFLYPDIRDVDQPDHPFCPGVGNRYRGG
jgi:Cu/Ag efflux pump CusA